MNKLCKWGCWFITAQQPNFSSYLEQDGKRKQKQYWCQDFRSGKNWEAGEIRNYLCFCEKEVRLMTFPPKFFDVLKTNKHYLCRGVAIGETVRLYESSRVSFIPTMCILQQKVVHVYVFLKKTDSGSTKGVTSKCKQENSFKLSMVQFWYIRSLVFENQSQFNYMYRLLHRI